jgi:hypothetical protein
VLRIRPDAYDASFDALAADVERALAQLQRWRPTVPEAAEGGSDGTGATAGVTDGDLTP